MALTRSRLSAQPVAQPVTQKMVESAQADEARIADVLLLLESMFEREHVTVGLIINALYDIASVHLIDQRVTFRPLNQVARWSARLTKPVVRLIAIRWVKRKCPRLIASWLYTKVKFEPKQIAQVVEAIDTIEIDQVTASIQAPVLAELEVYRQRVRLLQSRIRMLILLLVSVILTLGGGLAWSAWQTHLHPTSRSIESPAP